MKSKANRLPDVPALDGAPSAGAERVVEAARAGAAPGAPRKKPSGAWFLRRKKARERGEPDPPLPPGTSLHPRPGPGAALRDYGLRSFVPAPDPVPPATEPPPAADPPPLKRLELADVKAETEQRAASDLEESAAAQRVELLTIGRPDLERRVGSLGALGFRLVGIVLGDDETWPLSETQRDELAVLFVEAFPDECAQLVQGGNMAKIIAIGTLGNVVRQKWTTYRAKKSAPAAVSGAAPAEPRQAAPAPGKRFAGDPDMLNTAA